MSSRIVRKSVPRSTAIAYMSARIGEDHDMIAVALSHGQFFVFVPEEVEPYNLVDLNVGGIFYERSRRPSHHSDVALVLSHHMTEDWPKLGKQIYFQDPLTKSVEHFQSKTDLVSIGDFQYFIVKEIRSSPVDLIETLIKKYRCAWRFLALLLTGPHKSAAFRDLGPLISSIAVDAYDGESFLLWERDH